MLFFICFLLLYLVLAIIYKKYYTFSTFKIVQSDKLMFLLDMKLEKN